MGREIQKKKRRSKRQPIRQSNKPKRALNPRGNDLIARNWDKKETLAQNYKRLGLASRLRRATGGTEKHVVDSEHAPSATSSSGGGKRNVKSDSGQDLFAIQPLEKAIISEARVERDADGNITRVIHSGSGGRRNPLHDPLRELDSDSESETAATAAAAAPVDQHGGRWEEWAGIEEDGDTEVVRRLVTESRNPAEKKPRHQSAREKEWLQRLVGRWGDDYAAMARDARLNPMQQTAADLKRRIVKMHR